MKKFKFEDLDLFYQEKGAGTPLVLVHGLGSDHTIWEGIIPYLSKYYHVLAPDLRGHGLSTKTKGPYSMELFAQDIIKFMEHKQLKNAHFIGQSMGGAIVQQLVLNNPEKLLSMTLISTFSYVDIPLKKIFLKLKDLTIESGYNAFFQEAVRLTNTPDFIQTNKEFLKERMELMNGMVSTSSLIESINACLKVNYIESLPRIGLPTLILAGAEDILTPPYHALDIHKAIKHSQKKVLPDVGHNLTVEKPQEAYELIKEFLG